MFVLGNHVPKCRLSLGKLMNLAVLGVVLISSVNCAVPPRERHQDKAASLDPITLDELLNGTIYRPRDFLGQWSSESDDLIRIFKPMGIYNYNLTDAKESPVLFIQNITENWPTLSNIIFSPDGNYALIEHGRLNLWRYSALAKYDIFDMKTRDFVARLEPPGVDEENRNLQLVQWSPTGNGIAFVYNYNIYYRANAEKDTPVVQLTHDGADEEKAIYNGIADWVYEEEMFGSPTALWISKSGKHLAFVKFDDTQVREFEWPIYGEPGSNETIYPHKRKIRYPKVGTPNPVAEVYVAPLTEENSEPRKVTYPAETPLKDLHIIGIAEWASETEVLVATLNRVQNVSRWFLCDAESANADCREIYKYELERGWVDMNTPFVSENGESFIFRQSLKEGSSAFSHIAMFKRDGSSIPITTGNLSVENILGWDQANGTIYFSGTFWDGVTEDPSEAQIYSVPDDGTKKVRCITCNLKNSVGNRCRQNSVMFSLAYTKFIHKCNGPDVPETTTRYTETGEVVEIPGPTNITNLRIRDVLARKAVPITKDYAIPVGDGLTARARLYLPADFDENKKYPLLISVYGGPGSQNVGQMFGINWETTMVSDKGVIFGQIDGRGTKGSSSEHLFSLYRNLGVNEVADQIAVTKHLIETLGFIDPQKTAIWGWSYGGFATAKVLQTDDENVFKCGIAVAPVTNWRYYDTIYTERYMGLPTTEDNLAGYLDSDVTAREKVEKMRNKQFMLIHGNADDNVHYQQSMILTRAMEQADVYFHQLSYPDENHAISGPGMKRHLYHSLQRFLFDECYKDNNSGGGGRGSGSSIASSLYVTGLSLLIIVYRCAF